ncbi:MAG: DUF3833 family protein, partial [Paracoccaceae bacterium]
MKILTILLLLIVLITAARAMFFSFHAQNPADYAGTRPAFSLKEVLSGRIMSEGLVYGPNGKMTNSFVAEMVGEWEGNTGTLSEHFTYSNGKIHDRKWYLKLGAGNTFTATAEDIVGEATGVVSGSTVSMKYKIVLPPEAGGHTLSV